MTVIQPTPQEIAGDGGVISGLTFVDDTKLSTDFRRLRGNKMYFIERCTFFESNGVRGESRIITLTPEALFIVNFQGLMERATTYDHITDLYTKKMKEKKLLSFSSSEHHLLVKIPTELDCHISFSSTAILQKCITILLKLLMVKRGINFSIKEIAPECDIEKYCNDRRPDGYFTPREVIEINRQRTVLQVFIQKLQKELVGILDEIDSATAQYTVHEGELAALKQQGINESSVRRCKSAIEEKQMRLNRQVLEKSEESERLLSDVAKLQSELTMITKNEEALIEKAVMEMNDQANKTQDHSVALRQRAQLKEKAALQEEIDGYTRELLDMQSRKGAKNKDAEERFNTSFTELVKDLETVFRLEKFLATINNEVRLQSDLINQQNIEKRELMEAHESKIVTSSNALPLQLGVNILEDPLLALGMAGVVVDDVLFGSSSIPSDVNTALDDVLGAPVAEDDLL